MSNVRYRVQEVLGAGGSGLVHKAFDEVEGRFVAMKRLAPGNAGKSADRQRQQALLEREFYVLAELAHPKVIRVYDYGVDDDGPYYTMEWLKGQSLRKLSPLPFQKACSLLRDVASSLAIVHSRRLIHRDVTPQNIYCSDDDHAKLIDFGAMSPMGIPKVLMGTPPFIAPESLRFEPVDGRTDLFSLGASLYYALTGRHAYPARTIAELETVWRTAPVPPSRFAPGIPDSLNRLVLELLSLQPTGRPCSAADVFERLTAAASLDASEQPAVANAYLASPALAGRGPELARLRRGILKAARGEGRAVVVAGPPGIGRTRLLNAAVLEAKIAGFFVLRAESFEGSGEPFAALHAMARPLREVAPEAASLLEATRVGDARRATTGQTNEDAHVQGIAQAIRDLASRRAVALAVDDLQSLDEWSLAVLATLATQVANRKLLLIGTLDSEATRRNSSAMALLFASSKRLELAPLAESDTRELFASLFGDVQNLDTVAVLAHTSARGNPRGLLDAAQGLIDGNLAAYEGGAWTISNDSAAIDKTLDRSLDVQRRIGAFSPAAGRLLSVLSLDRDATLALADYAPLVFDGNAAQANQALSELLQAEVVAMVGDRSRFVRDKYREAGRLLLPEAERRRIHARLAEHTVVSGADPIYSALHFHGAGNFEEAASALNRVREAIEANPRTPLLKQPILLDTLECVLDGDGDFGEAFRAEHGAGMVMNAMFRGLPERAAARAPNLLKRLSRLTALDDYHESKDADPMARLGKALALAEERCRGSGDAFTPVTAIRRVCQLSVSTALCARFMADPMLLDAIPDLSPFSPLSNGVALTARLVALMASMVHGRDWEAWSSLEELLADLRGGAGETLDPLTRAALEGAALGQLCALQAEHAAEGAPSNIDEYAARMPSMAESCRARYYLAQGRPNEAEAARRAFELVSLRSDTTQEARIIELPSYLALYAICDDILGLKRVRSGIAEITKTRPRWKSRLALAEAHVARCRGDYATGLSKVEASLSDLSPDHGDWGPTVALRVALLDHAGHHHAAIDLGMGYLKTLEERGVPRASTALAVALAFGHTGDGLGAERLLALARSLLEARGVAGIHLGRCHEVGARIATRRGDAVAFAERAAACAKYYRCGENPVLTARHDALMRANAVSRRPGASSEDSVFTEIVAPHHAASATLPSASGSELVMNSGVHESILAALVAESGALGGFLYVQSGSSLSRVFGTSGLESPIDLDTEVAEYLAGALEPDTVCADGPSETKQSPMLESRTGQRFIPRLLEGVCVGLERVSGIALLAVADDANVAPAPAQRAGARTPLAHEKVTDKAG